MVLKKGNFSGCLSNPNHSLSEAQVLEHYQTESLGTGLLAHHALASIHCFSGILFFNEMCEPADIGLH